MGKPVCSIGQTGTHFFFLASRETNYAADSMIVHMCTIIYTAAGVKPSADKERGDDHV